MTLALVIVSLTARAASRPAPPDAPAQDAAERLVKDIFRADYAKQAPADRLALSRKLLGRAAGLTGDLPGLYVRLREARDAAIAAADAGGAAEAVRRLHDAFAIPLAGRVEDWSRVAAATAHSPGIARVVVQSLLGLSAEAAEDDHYDVAAKAAAQGRAAAQAVGDVALTVEAERQQRRVRDLQQQHAAFLAAQQKLTADADDRAANLAAGSFLCLAKGDWQRGLPMLAKGADQALAVLAQRELVAPGDAEAQLALADGWWDAAERQPKDGSGRQRMRERAAQWYKAATPKVTGLVREKAVARVAEAAAGMVAPAATRQSGAVDLLASFDPKADPVGGKWERTRDGLAFGPGGGNKVRFTAYAPPAEYDYRVTFTRVEGNGNVVLVLTHAGRSFMWGMGEFGNTATGFGRVGGKNFGANPASVKGRFGLTSGQRYECVVKVRDDGVAAYLDGKMLVQYKTDFSDMAPQPAWDVGPDRLGVGGGSRTILHAVEVTEIGK